MVDVEQAILEYLWGDRGLTPDEVSDLVLMGMIQMLKTDFPEPPINGTFMEKYGLLMV